ncbi:hypothetical protein MTO96_042397, partial [Rhipicephalus appendiculatus]
MLQEHCLQNHRYFFNCMNLGLFMQIVVFLIYWEKCSTID